MMYRPYTTRDMGSVQLLMEQLGYCLTTSELERNIDAIRQKGGEVIVAESGGDVVGCISVLLDARLAEGVYAEIVSLVVLEKCRGEGIGKALVERAEEWAKNRVVKIRVRANSVRKEAHSFYKSLGYTEVKTQKVLTKVVESAD